MGVIFDTQNSQLLTWSLPTEEIFFRYTAKIGLWQIFQLSIFVLSREKYHCQSHWIRNFCFFCTYFSFLPILRKFKRRCLWTIRIFQCFSGHGPKNFDKRPWIENGEGFAVHSSTRPSGAKGEWRVRSWLAISNTREKYDFFHVCCYSLSQGWKSFYNTVVYVIKQTYFLSSAFESHEDA